MSRVVGFSAGEPPMPIPMFCPRRYEMSDTADVPDKPADTSPTSEGTMPPVHAGWAVATLLCFWPLAFSAFTHAFNVYPLWAER